MLGICLSGITVLLCPLKDYVGGNISHQSGAGSLPGLTHGTWRPGILT